MKKKEFLKNSIINLFIIAGLCIFFVAEVLVTQLIPQSLIRENALEGKEQLLTEGLYFHGFSETNIFNDNWTDCYYLNIIVSQDADRPLYSAIANNMAVNPEDENDVMDAMEHAFIGDYEYQPYSNYWLGINLIIKSLLTILPYSGIRFIFYCLTVLLTVLIMVSGYKKLESWQFPIAYLFATVSLGLFQNIGCFAYVSDYLMMQLMVLFVILSYDKEKWNRTYRNRMFLILGLNQFFWGFLLAPMYVLGMACFALYLMDEKHEARGLKYLSTAIPMWLIGYGISTAFKQLLAKIIVGDEIGTAKLDKWTSGNLVARLKAGVYHITHSILTARATLIVWIIAIVIVLVLCMVKILKLSINRKKLLSDFIICIICFIFPYVYCAVLVRAVGHGFYVQNYVPWIASGMYMVLDCFSYNKAVSESENKNE